MRKIFLIRFFQLLFLALSLPLGATVSLDHLDEDDKQTSLELLETADLDSLWDNFLSVQTELYFTQEADLIEGQKFWQKAENVLELGSGNGAYLHKLSARFQDKNYLGIEKQSKPVSQSEQNFSGSKLKFREGDAEVTSEDLKDQFDVVLFRLTLQHLRNPRLALEHAYTYLKDGGHVVIIDAYDAARTTSHPIATLEEASRQHNEKNKKEEKGNRRITMEVLGELKKGAGPLSKLYEVVFTNLNEQGLVLKNVVKFENKQEMKLYFTLSLLYLGILHYGWGIPVDFPKAYEELQVMLEDEQAWTCPGMHFLILKKRSPKEAT